MTRMDHLLEEFKATDEGNVDASWWVEDFNWVARENSSTYMYEVAEVKKQEDEYRRQVRRATAALYSTGLEVVLQALSPQPQWQAWLRSSAYRGSGRWLAGISHNLQGEFQFIGDIQYRITLQLRMLLEPVQPNNGTCPLCQAQSIQPLHLLDCPDGQWFFTHRHDAVRDIVVKFIRSTGNNPEVEPLLDNTSNAKADICYARHGTQLPVLIDVTTIFATIIN